MKPSQFLAPVIGGLSVACAIFQNGSSETGIRDEVRSEAHQGQLPLVCPTQGCGTNGPEVSGLRGNLLVMRAHGATPAAIARNLPNQFDGQIWKRCARNCPDSTAP
jgi:hypothetical protein